MRLLIALLLLLPLTVSAQWSSTNDQPAVGYICAVDVGHELAMATGGDWYQLDAFEEDCGLSTGGSLIVTGGDVGGTFQAIDIKAHGGGEVDIFFSLSLASDGVADCHCMAHLDGVMTSIGGHATFAAAARYLGIVGVGTMDVVSGNTFTIECSCAGDNETLTFDHAEYRVRREGP